MCAPTPVSGSRWSDPSTTKVLLTGGTGHVGANLLRELVHRGYRPHVTVRQDTLPWRIASLSEQVQTHGVDLTDHDAVRALCEATRPDVVVHAATYGAYAWQQDVDRMIDVNARATQSLLDASRAGGSGLFVNLGSSSEYGPRVEAMSERDLAEPDRPYGVTKLAQTQLCRTGSTDAMQAITLRLFSVYGPWEEPGRLVPNLLLAALRGTTFVGSSPEVARDFVWIDDVCSSVLDFDGLAQIDEPVVNLGTGRQTSLGALVETVEQSLDVKVNVSWSAQRLAAWDHPTWRADTTLALRVLRHNPPTSLAEGLRKFAQWLSANDKHYDACEHN